MEKETRMDKSIVNDSYLLFKFIKDVRHDKEREREDSITNRGKNGGGGVLHDMKIASNLINGADDDSSVFEDGSYRNSVRSDSVCSYEDMLTQRNSIRGSIVEDSDCISSCNAILECKNNFASCENNTVFYDKDLMFNVERECDILSSNFVGGDSMNGELCSVNQDVDMHGDHFYGSFSLGRAVGCNETRKIREKEENQNLNEEMKKYYHKITSIRKKVFICEYCRCKFVYKKCLVNHVEKNHFGKE